MLPHWLSGNVLVKASGEVALQQFVIINSFCYDSADKLEIAKMFRVVVGELINGVGDPVLGC